MDSILDLSALSISDNQIDARMETVIVSYWKLHSLSTSWLDFDHNLPLHTQVIAAINREQRITLPADVRVCLGGNTPFHLTVLEAETSLADIRAWMDIHHTVSGEWVSAYGRLMVHVLPSYCTDDPNSQFMRQCHSGYW